MTERQQELERRLQDVTGQLGSNKKGTKKGKYQDRSCVLLLTTKINNNISVMLQFAFSRSFLDDSSKANPQNQSRQSSSSSSSDSSSSSSSDSSSSDSSDSEAGQSSKMYKIMITIIINEKKRAQLIYKVVEKSHNVR